MNYDAKNLTESRRELNPPCGKKQIAVLGSTGSIGTNTLEVVRVNQDKFQIVTLAAGNNIELLIKQIREFSPEFVSVKNEADLKYLNELFPELKKSFGPGGAESAATYESADIVVSAIVGAAGFLPTLAAIRAGKDIALANKESMVLCGKLIMDEVESHGVRLIPVDSEHSAVFQSLEGHRKEDVKRIILTASGGPFLKSTMEELQCVTPKEALNHPTWDMGRRITIDSATLMNKGLEVIEACWLFDIPPEKVSVCIHPQSIVHSMVEYVDGSIIAQMGSSDMKGPIAYALSYPERVESGVSPCSLAGKTLEFMEPDTERFPALSLAYRAIRFGGLAPCVLNAADEVGVEMFLESMIKFTDIPKLVSSVLDDFEFEKDQFGRLDAASVVQADTWARKKAGEMARKLIARAI